MKCPSCGMNLRDETVVCGYCGEKIPESLQKRPDSAGRQHPLAGPAAQKGVQEKSPAGGGEAGDGEEEEGGLSPYLQPGEQVLIGSLNVSVKKFFFHAYLTDRRIFLIDTQEKKLKVTAKDVPRNTLAGSIIEYSENSDPVLVLSIRSPDDEIKTMKIVFVQNGMDRSAEIDEWIALLEKEEKPAKAKKAARKEPQEPEKPAVQPAEPKEAEEPEEIPEKPPARPKAPVKAQELRPAKKPVKELEKQPPVKRLISVSKPAPEVPAAAEPPVTPPRRAQVRQVPEPVPKVPVVQEDGREAAPAPRDSVPPVKKPEVQSAMKVAMKGAMKPLAQPQGRPLRREISEHPPRRPVVEPEVREPPAEPRRPRIHERVHEPLFAEPAAPAEEQPPAEVPQFCHNCGKKLPVEANFCPGCGTRLGQNRTLPGSSARIAPPAREKRPVPADTVPVPAERRPAAAAGRAEDHDDGDFEDEKPQPTKPPVKKAPRGSEMTILHKFLRR